MSNLTRALAALSINAAFTLLVHAAPITIQFAGQWTTEIHPSQATLVPDSIVPVQSAPVNFTATVIVDPANGQPPVYGVYQHFVDFEPVSVASEIMNYSVENPYAEFGVTTSTKFTHSSQWQNTNFQPDPVDNYWITLNQWSINIGWNAGTWATSFNLGSPRYRVATEDVGPVTEQEMVQMLYDAFGNGDQFSAGFYSHVGYGVFPAGFSLAGSAQIISITTVPEPTTISLFVAALAMAALSRRRRKSNVPQR